MVIVDNHSDMHENVRTDGDSTEVSSWGTATETRQVSLNLPEVELATKRATV